jgi:hypothetical protein
LVEAREVPVLRTRLGRTAIACALLVASGGCATVPMATKDRDAAAKAFAASPDQCSLYVYRASEWGTAVKFPVTLDGRMLGELPGSTFIFVTVPPGPHTLYVSGENSRTVSFTAEAGKAVYVKVTPTMGWASAGVSLTLMTDVKEAQEDVRGCSLIQGM